jgi:hypothetical protein
LLEVYTGKRRVSNDLSGEPHKDSRLLAAARRKRKQRIMNISFKTLGSSRPNISFSKVQTYVGLAAGILSITGAMAAFFRPAPNKGELVVVVEDAKTQETISDATIEVLTPQDAVITQLKPSWSGKASFRMDEGHYRVRVEHPRYAATVREVQLISSQSTEVRIQLHGATSLSNTVRRLFHH